MVLGLIYYKKSDWFDADNFSMVIHVQTQTTITGFLIALTASAFHDAFKKSYIDQQAFRLPLNDFIVERLANNPAVLATKGAQLFTILQ